MPRPDSPNSLQANSPRANSPDRYLIFSDLNCPFCFAMHERITALNLHNEVEWCLIEHAPAFSSETMTEDQGALLEHEYGLVKQRAKEVGIKQPRFCVNTHLALLTYYHVHKVDKAKGQQFLHTLYQAYWMQGEDISDPQVLYELLEVLELSNININAEDRIQLNERQKQWQQDSFERRIPAIQAPDGQVMLGLQNSESIREFIENNNQIQIEQGQTCLHNGNYNLAFLTSEFFSNSIQKQESGFSCYAYSSINELIEEHRSIKFDALVICFQSDKKSDFSYIRHFKNKVGQGINLPVLYVTDSYSSEEEIQAFTLGADDYIRLDSGISAICARMNRMLAQSRIVQVLHQHASVDGLTGIINKREFKNSLYKEWRNSCRQKLNLSMIMIDIDYFKKYNDSQGHCAGDEVLRKVSKTLGLNLYRAKDILARFGGEEFVILLPETDSSGLEFVCQQLRHNVENQEIDHPESDVSQYITISIGGCYSKPHPDQSALKLMELADEALYEAKGRGRNQYSIKTMDAIRYE